MDLLEKGPGIAMQLKSWFLPPNLSPSSHLPPFFLIFCGSPLSAKQRLDVSTWDLSSHLLCQAFLLNLVITEPGFPITVVLKPTAITVT